MLSEKDPSLALPQEKTRFLGKGKLEIKIVIDEECHKRLEKLKNLLSHKNPSLSYGELLSILSQEGLKKHDLRKRNTKKKSQKNQKKVSPAKSEFKSKKGEREVVLIKEEREKVKEEKNTTISTEKGKFKNRAIEEKVTSPKKPIQKNPTKHQTRKISRSIPSSLRKYIWERDQGRCTYVHYETKRRCSSKYLLQIDHIQPFSLGGRTEKENLRLLCAGHNQYRR